MELIDRYNIQGLAEAGRQIVFLPHHFDQNADDCHIFREF